MKKNIFIIGLCIALAVCIWFLLQPDKQHNIPDKSEVIANNDSLQSHGVDYRRANDSLTKDSYRKDSTINSLRQGQATTRKQLDLKTVETKTLSAQLKAANKDTALNAKIDSLINEINNMAFLLAQYEAYADSINNVNDSLKLNHEVTVQEKDKRIAELQAAYDKLFKDYMDLFADTGKLMKDLKREKLKTKIVAVLACAAAVLGLIK